MDDRISKIKTPEGCEIFAKNALERNQPELAKEAKLRAIELRALKHNAKSAAENEALKAVYAYEEVLQTTKGKKIRATRTWQMIKRHGIIEAVERAVNRSTETQGYTLLVEMGLEDFAFEAVILRYPEVFSIEAVKKARNRLETWKAIKNIFK